MYIIEFEKGVYAALGTGDPARTLNIRHAQKFCNSHDADTKMRRVLKRIKEYRVFPSSRVVWLDEVSLKLKS